MLRCLAVVALCAVTLAASTTGLKGPPAASSTATAQTVEQQAAPGAEAPIDTVPWSQVGAGWTLATWSPVSGGQGGGDAPVPGEATFQQATTTLYLVDPQGGRYPITTFPPAGDGPSPTLADWSGDGTRALFYEQGPQDGKVIEVDLHTGKQTSFPVVRGFDVAPRYTRPDGKAVLLLKSDDVYSTASLHRVDLSGQPQLTYPVDKLFSEFNAEMISTPDGKQLVLGTKNGLALMGNDGSLGKPLPIDGASNCRPTRWWNPEATVALARCFDSDYATQLWLVPVDATPPTPLTPRNLGQYGDDLGDENAWQLPQGTFVQATGACGFRYLAKLNADGSTTAVTVPDVDENSSVLVLGANDDHLTLQATASCGTGESLLDYKPATNTSTVLLGPPLNGGGVIGALPHP